MFPTQSRLSGVVCPLHVIGQCSRPYCHFKHSPNIPQQQQEQQQQQHQDVTNEPAGVENMITIISIIYTLIVIFISINEIE